MQDGDNDNGDDDDVEFEAEPSQNVIDLQRALSDHNYRLVAWLIEEMIAQAIDEHEAVNHADK